MAGSRASRGEQAAGLTIAAFGAGAALVAATSYPIGTAASMGPGYLPILLGLALCGLGGLIAWRAGPAVVTPDRAGALRPAGMVLGAVLLFGASIATLGVAITGALTILGAALGSREARLVESVALASVMMVAVTLVFVELLGLPFRVWPL